MSIISQQEAITMPSSMSVYNNELIVAAYEPMTKRRRIVPISNNYRPSTVQSYVSFLQQQGLIVSIMPRQNISHLTTSSYTSTNPMPTNESQDDRRRKVPAGERRRIATTTTASSNTTSSSLIRDDLSIDDLVKPMEHLSINCPLSRSTTPSTSNLPVELQKQSLDGLVDRFARLDIKDDGAEDDGDIIMTQASTLLEEPVYHFGVDAEQQVSSFRNLVELTATQKLRLHRQRRQEFMKKRINKHTLNITRRK